MARSKRPRKSKWLTHTRVTLGLQRAALPPGLSGGAGDTEARKPPRYDSRTDPYGTKG